MKMYLLHGRLNPDSEATDVRGEKTRSWGFDGPTLPDVESIHFNYDTLFVAFKDEASLEQARELTGWHYGYSDNSLALRRKDSCIEIFNRQQFRLEYFGDFSIES